MSPAEATQNPSQPSGSLTITAVPESQPLTGVITMKRRNPGSDKENGCPLNGRVFCALLLALPALAATPAQAADLNLREIDRYAGRASPGLGQVTNIEQFTDLRPGDWAWQALDHLVERYGCVAGYPDGSFGGRRSMTRFEAAALLHACLDRVTEVTDELKRLTTEFGAELALLRGRVDGLEARVGELEATRFAPTTRLGGLATFVVGTNRFTGSNREAVDEANAAGGGTTFNYDLQLAFDTSFTGKDQLRAQLRAGNFADSPFGGNGPGGDLSTLEIAFEQDCGNGGDTDTDCGDAMGIDKLYYRWPLGSGFTALLGGRIGQEDMLAVWPSVYPADTVLNVFTLNGAPAAYNKNIGPGAGLWWQSHGLSVSANYVAANGNSGDPSRGGLGTSGSAGTGTVQIAYASEQWAVAAIYSAIQSGVELPGTTPFTAAGNETDPASHTDAFGLSGFWQPLASGWIPSISWGWGINRTSYDGDPGNGALRTSQSWLVGLQWQDAFLQGNVLGMAVGQPVFATSLIGGETPDDGGVVLEGWYKFQLSDAITVTPAVFWLSRPLGQETPPGGSFGQLGGLIRTAFSF
jgi:hypothetical protein